MMHPKFKNEYNLPGRELLPHREPFLFLDRLVSADETGCIGEYTFTAEKNDFSKVISRARRSCPAWFLLSRCASAQVRG